MLTSVLMVLVPTLLGTASLVYFISRRPRASGWLLFYAAVGLGLGLFGYRGLARQLDAHRFITTLDAAELSSITVAGKTFEDPESMTAITSALRSSEYFVSSHTEVSQPSDFEIRMKSGRIVRYRCGYIHNGRDMLIFDATFTFQDANKDLVGLIEELPR